MTEHSNESKTLIAGISILIGIGLKLLLRKGWEIKYDEEAPDINTSEKLNWGKLFLWTFMTGLVLRIIKISLKRTLTIAMKREKLLMK